MSTKQYTLQVLMIIIALDILATRKLIQSDKINLKVKIINVVLTWLLPFIWASFVLSFSDKPPKKTGKFDSNRVYGCWLSRTIKSKKPQFHHHHEGERGFTEDCFTKIQTFFILLKCETL